MLGHPYHRATPLPSSELALCVCVVGVMCARVRWFIWRPEVVTGIFINHCPPWPTSSRNPSVSTSPILGLGMRAKVVLFHESSGALNEGLGVCA